MLSEAEYQELSKYLEPHAPSQAEYERFASLKQAGYLRIHQFGMVDLGPIGRHPAPDTWVITAAGRDALSEFEERRDQEAKREAQQRLQNQIAVAQVLVPLVTFVLGLIVEHYSGLVSALAELLGRGVK